jgi:NADPH:quinone reductase-like Zn-dependent oxidoreductase
MRRIELPAPATLDSLRVRQCEIPAVGADEVLVKIRSSSLNFHDYRVATGALPTGLSRVPMSDGLGEVVELGAAVTDFVKGDRVLGTFFPDWLDGAPTAVKIANMRGDQVDGFASEFVALPASSFTKAPVGLTDVEAATLPCAALVAWRALVVEGHIKPGDSVLIQGTGGVSLFALQFAKLAGAAVIALSSSEEKLTRLKSLGADDVLNYREFPFWGRRVMEITGGSGVDHVVELVGGDLTDSLKALRTGGNIYVIGALGGQSVNYSARAIIGRNAHVIGLTVGSRSHLRDMIKSIERSGLKPVIDRVFPFEEISHAFRHLEARGHFGKIGLSW